MKTVWITGAGSGIGCALAKSMADHGWQVLATARDETKLQTLADYNDNIQALPADLTDDVDLKTLADFFILRDRVLDAVVVNAGVCEYMNKARLDMQSLRRVFDVNLFAAAATIDIALPSLKKAGGVIVGISSMSTYLPFTRAEYYGASKAAFNYYLQSLRIDLKLEGVSVTEVYPGFVKTPLSDKNDFAMPFRVSAEQAAQCIERSIVRKQRQCAFPGRMHYLLKMLSLLPGLWQHLHRAEAG